MKSFVALLLLWSVALGASAASLTTFGPATSCPSYCIGFATDGAILDWLNPTYALASPPHTVLSIAGKTYSGNTSPTFVAQVGTHNLYQVTGILTAADTSQVSIAYTLEYWTTKVVSGRDAGRLTPHRLVTGGTFMLP